MDYHALVDDLLMINSNDVQGMHRLARLLTDLSDPTTRQLLDNIRDLETAITNINNLDDVKIIPPDTLTQRGRFKYRVERMSTCEGTMITPKGSAAPEPYFQRFELILCQFGGVGWEYDGPHYALVWEDDHTDSELTIIPTTSQFTKEYSDEFSIGLISGLPPKNTILSVRKMMRISRKRVIKHRGRYVQGQVHTRLQSLVKERIENALAIWHFGEIPLDHYIRNNIGVALPVDFLTHYQNMRFIPVRDVQWDRQTLTLHYRKWDETTMRSMLMKNPTIFMKMAHKKFAIYDPLFSNDPTRISAAAAEYNRLY